MSYRNFQSIPSQIVSRQKQAIRIKESQLSHKFKWLSKYLSPQNDDNVDEHNVIAKSAKFHQKTNSRKFRSRAKTQNQTCLLKIVEQPGKQIQMKHFCVETLREHSQRPLTSQKHIKRSSLIIQQIKPDKLRGKSFLLHNFNSTSIGKLYSRKENAKSFLNKGKLKLNLKKNKVIAQQRFILSPWGFHQEENKENVFLNDQIAFL